MTATWLTFALLAALGFYLASAHQRLWPRARGRHRMLRVAASLGGVLSTAVAIMALGTWPGVFSALSALMLGWVLLPYVDAWRQRRQARRAGDRHVG